jgi:hypothetical protein
MHSNIYVYVYIYVRVFIIKKKVLSKRLFEEFRN